MPLSRVAKLVGKLGVATKHAFRSFTDIDTNPIPTAWTHITKVDPEDEKKLPLLYPAYLQHTSAISVGGSRDVNSKNTEDTFELLQAIDTPVFHEPSAAQHVTPKTREYSEFLAIPEVLNGDSDSLIGTLGEGTEYLRNEMVPQLIHHKLSWIPSFLKADLADFLTSLLLESAVFEAYIIQNENSAAARESNVTTKDRLSPAEAAQRALAAEKHLESPVIYVEYSGTFGGEEAEQILSAISGELRWSRLWYGGGISNRQQAESVLKAGADTVIVGNVFHEIASDEEEIWQQAKGDLESETDMSHVEEWIEEEIDVENTNAYRFLTTIPSVEQPEIRAQLYLSETLSLRLLIDDLLKNKSTPTTLEALKRRLEDRGLSTEELAISKEYLTHIRRYINSQGNSNTVETETMLSHIQGLAET